MKLVRALPSSRGADHLNGADQVWGTIREIRELVDVKPIVKSSFNCARCPEFMEEFEDLTLENAS